MNMYEQVSILGHQMSLAGGDKAEALDSESHWGVAGLEGPCTVRFNAFWVMVTWEPPSPVNRQTDTTENIAFPQLRNTTIMDILSSNSDALVLPERSVGEIGTKQDVETLIFVDNPIVNSVVCSRLWTVNL